MQVFPGENLPKNSPIRHLKFNEHFTRTVAKETVIDKYSGLFRKSQILMYWIWAVKPTYMTYAKR